MHWLTVTFLFAITAATLTRLWLASRQISAVTAHREHVPELFARDIAAEDQRKAADYTVARVKLGRVELVFAVAMTLVWTLGGGIAAVDSLWRAAGWSQPWLGTAVILSVLGIGAVLHLPFSAWRTFRLEARFGFNRMTPGLFLVDTLKRLLIAGLLGVPLVLAVLVLMERAGDRWWLFVWLVWAAFSMVITWAWPRFLAPLFNRFTPLSDRALRDRIEALIERCGFASRGVFVMDGSRRSAHGNAYFTGIGRHKRIVFFDTLIERLEPSEVEAVLAHELGHFRLKHVRQRLVLSLGGALVGLALLGWFARQPDLYAALGVPTPSTHSALLLFLLVAPSLTFFITPVASWWSRRHELAADDFATTHADAGALSSALVKLYRDNASTLTPDRLHSAFYDSHPPALVRIARLRPSAA